jgi:hypothetical protein
MFGREPRSSITHGDEQDTVLERESKWSGVAEKKRERGDPYTDVPTADYDIGEFVLCRNRTRSSKLKPPMLGVYRVEARHPGKAISVAQVLADKTMGPLRRLHTRDVVRTHGMTMDKAAEAAGKASMAQPEVEKIITRTAGDRLMVKWRGYPYPTYEPRDGEVSRSEAYAEFLRREQEDRTETIGME